jgi:hypothetical protein
VIRFANLPSLVFPGKNKAGYILDREVHFSNKNYAETYVIGIEIYICNILKVKLSL